ncbi:uncharacterized protein PADG_04019 [Paracoccidioides brasiliensis Pb18]|uniref:Uncharacterized protein n=2 Tax=Paracoccidioides brasiliensis TaxID=121759 RepID=C1G9T3_PARBD|nr:uncharacterized protein PADG_04019 [Paracoccidioides brasiliensis Pb18]EEH47935.1 hypothetical protein PADG_04019 [Paracoccidioides brasiliensis Pb18]ODH25193.1 hypothetical protein ACO22_05242 [Paracoccidioides brasiliensis]ODH50905.1 hypothetical protein GX48_02865 [Paracoccidioides brasiliensis]
MSPSSPMSPSRRRRNPSNLALSSDSPSAFTPNGYSQSPLKSPQTPRYPIPMSPMSPRQPSSEAMDRSARFSVDFTAQADSGGGGLGNLADELADVWDEDGECEEDESGFHEEHDHVQIYEKEDDSTTRRTHDARSDSDEEHSRDGESNWKSLQIPKQKSKAGQQQRSRRRERLYDGSDYGNDSDFGEPGDLTPGLEARMAALENLVRWSTGNNGSSGQIVQRIIESLRELVGQSGIENSATRLITAHASLTSHLTSQTRALQTLTHPLLFSPFPILSSEAIDDLIPLINDILPNLPFPVPKTPHSQQSQTSVADPLHSLQALLSQTSDLTHTLRALNDTIHESRQLISAASRRLKSVRELVAEMQREEERREEGTRWIEKGEWDRRLQEREAGRVCGDVVSGFEAVCGEWRARLFGSEVAAAS